MKFHQNVIQIQVQAGTNIKSRSQALSIPEVLQNHKLRNQAYLES